MSVISRKNQPKEKPYHYSLVSSLISRKNAKSTKKLRVKCISHPHQVPQQDVVVVDGEILAFLDVS